MFGTELDTAYFAGSPPQQNIHQPVVIEQPSQEPDIPKQITPPSYETSIPTITFPPNNNEAMIKELQMELEKQKQLNKKEQGEPLYDRFVSKKKDVMKLLSIALTVLLAISLHFVLSDLIKTYLANNDFKSNKEQLIKFMYPLSVLAVLWSVKVFNK